MMTARQKRRFLKQFQAQVEQERNGAPIPPDIAARMTKPKEPVTLWQVIAIPQDGGEAKAKPVFPAVLKPYAEEFAAVINRCVAEGKERIWAKAYAVPLTPIVSLEGVQ